MRDAFYFLQSGGQNDQWKVYGRIGEKGRQMQEKVKWLLHKNVSKTPEVLGFIVGAEVPFAVLAPDAW